MSSKQEAEHVRDNAVRYLWCALSELQDAMPEGDNLSDEDAELWAQCAAHSAIQSRLRETEGGEDEHDNRP